MSNGSKRSPATDPVDRFKGIVEALGPVRMEAERSVGEAFVTDTDRIEIAGRVVEAFDRRVQRKRLPDVDQAASTTKKS